MISIDLRSDTVTRPTDDMRAAMLQARVGDDVYGEDPSINALEERVADWLGKPAALLCSSGTQSNLLGILSHCQRGEEYIVGAPYHTYKYEAGGAAVLGGIVPQTVPVESDGSVDVRQIEAVIKADDPHFPISRLIALENTHLGQVIPQNTMRETRQLADSYGLSLHLDGARLANAHIASGLSMSELAAPFDSVSVCCSKGLGAPVGSLLCGNEDLIKRARRWRKMLGGGMRQAGILAAAIDYALDHNVQRLQDDHHHAQLLAVGLSGCPHIRVEGTPTNMLYVVFAQPQQAEFVAEVLAGNGIRVPASQRMRLVTHLDISQADIAYVLERFYQAVAQMPQ